jgi:hypothetical protein
VIEESAAFVASQYEPGGPAAAACDWLDAIFVKKDAAAAWPQIAPEFRRAIAHAFVSANKAILEHAGFNVTEVEAGLADAEAPARHRLWTDFAPSVLSNFEQTALGGYQPDGWGIGSDPRPIGPDRELLALMRMPPGDGLAIIPEAREADAVLVMDFVDDRWLIAGVPERP